MGVHLNKATGKYYIRVKYYGREFEKVIGIDKKAAQLALAQVKLEIQASKLNGQGWVGFDKFKKAERPRTFADAVQSFMEERSNYKSSSIISYNSILKHYLLPAFGLDALKDISDSKVRRFQIELQKTVLKNGEAISESRVNTVMQLLRSILEEEKRTGILIRNPSDSVRRLQEPKSKIDPLSDDELRLALSNIDSHYQPFYITQAFTGARPNELQALRWSDIDWTKKQISITKGRVRGKEGLPKTAAGDRLVPMVPPVEEALKKLHQSKVCSLTDYVFLSKKGKPIDKHMDVIWSRALKKAGMRHRASYQLRHTFVTRCIMQQMPVPYIAKIIGHSTVDTIYRHYAGWIDAATSKYEQKLMESFNVTLLPEGLSASSQKVSSIS